MNTRGVTLLETLLYLALFGVVIGGLTLSAYSFFETSGRNQGRAILQKEQDFLVRKINWVLSRAESVSGPTTGTAGETLTAHLYGGGTAVIALMDGFVTLDGLPLNATGIVVSNLRFVHTLTTSTNIERVEAGFTMRMQTPNGMTILQSASTTHFLQPRQP